MGANGGCRSHNARVMMGSVGINDRKGECPSRQSSTVSLGRNLLYGVTC